MFEFSQLRCFLAVAEDLHFGRAAQRVNMTQPPLSRQIQLLEHELGVALFERTSRAVKLTPAGRTFLPEAKQMLRLAEGAVISAKRVARGESGSVTLGFTPGSSYAFLPRLAAIALEEMPDVDLVLKEMDSDDQMEALGAGRLDAGAVRLPVDRRGIELACVMREPILLAVCEGHPLAESNAPSLRDLERAAVYHVLAERGTVFLRPHVQLVTCGGGSAKLRSACKRGTYCSRARKRQNRRGAGASGGQKPSCQGRGSART